MSPREEPLAALFDQQRREQQRGFAGDLERRMDELGLYPIDAPVIFGSAVMKLHGLREQIGDVDVFVPARTYARLRDRGPGVLRNPWRELRPNPDDPPLLEAQHGSLVFHVFWSWTSRDRWLDVPGAVAAAERIHGVWCVPLRLVAFWKQESLRATAALGVEIAGSAWEKHEHDLKLLRDTGVAP